MKIVDTIYNNVYRAVIKACEPIEGWLKCNRVECVEARALLVYTLFKHGLSRSQIAEKTGLTKSAVINHINAFDDKKKCSRIMVMQQTIIEHELSRILERN